VGDVVDVDFAGLRAKGMKLRAGEGLNPGIVFVGRNGRRRRWILGVGRVSHGQIVSKAKFPCSLRKGRNQGILTRAGIVAKGRITSLTCGLGAETIGMERAGNTSTARQGEANHNRKSGVGGGPVIPTRDAKGDGT